MEIRIRVVWISDLAVLVAVVRAGLYHVGVSSRWPNTAGTICDDWVGLLPDT